VHPATVTTTIRGAGSALAYAAVWALFAGAVTLAWRRRILGFVLRSTTETPR
jgi:hypothetical protein